MDAPVLEIHRLRGKKNYSFAYDYKRGVLVARVPYTSSEAEVRGVIRAHDRAIHNLIEKGKRVSEEPFYLLGKMKERPEDEEGVRREVLSGYLQGRVKELARYARLYGPIEVKIRDMKTRYGVNDFRKRKLTFALSLSSYSPHVIDSVILHELTHFYVQNHGEDFYKRLYALCPDYQRCRKALIKHEYAYGNDQ